MTRVPSIVVLLIVVIVSAFSQEKPTPAGKPQPDLKALGVTAPDTLFRTSSRDSAAKASQGLPKFDLPEYVITGAVSIDLPDVEKQDASEPPHIVDLANPLDAARDRSTVEYESGGKEGTAIEARAANSGRIMASSGTYFNSKLGLWVSSMAPTYSVHGDAGYDVSKAYVPYANRSGGHVNVTGG